MMYVSQITNLYILSLHSAVCWLYLSKTRRETKSPNVTQQRREQQFDPGIPESLYSPVSLLRTTLLG